MTVTRTGALSARMSAGASTTVWAAWVVLALLALDLAGEATYLVLVGLSALVLHQIVSLPGPPRTTGERAAWRTESWVIAGLYTAVVGLLAIAFRGFGTEQTAGLFIFFALALLTGVAGPVAYTVAKLHLPLGELGLRWDNWRRFVPLALIFAGVQFGLTLWSYELPEPVDWVPLLVMALVVGVFESIFFRGFLLTRLQYLFGDLAGLGLAAALYGTYHVGYGMGLGEIAFLTGLGVVYGVAYALVRSIFVLWPLLTPVGSFYANVQAGDIDLPWASIAGFGEVFAVMAVVFWLGARRARKGRQRAEVTT